VYFGKLISENEQKFSLRGVVESKKISSRPG